VRGRWVEQRRDAQLSAVGGRRARRPLQWRAFIPDPVAELEIGLDGPAASDVADAQEALSDLRHAAVSTSGLEVLARRLLRTEAVASSRIEAIEVSHRRLAEAEAGASGQRYETARLVVGNVAAMKRGIELGSDHSHRLTVEDLESMHGLLMAGSPYRDDQQRAGRLRHDASFIGGSSPATADFVPPPPEEIPGLLDDVMRFINVREDLSVVVVAAVAHAQFETIHPFHDGNGRVGRSLIHMILRRHGAVETVTPPVSVVIAQDGSRYIDGLTRFREGDVAGWISDFAVTITRACKATQALAEDAADMVQGWRNAVNAQRGQTGQRLLRSDAAANQLLALLFEMPVLTTATVVDRLGVTWRTAHAGIAELENAGILVQTSLGKRNRVYEAREVFSLLDGFEGRSA
jgi:Fic family protein